MGLKDIILDAIPLCSFDKSGFERHKKKFRNEVYPITEKRIIISGATKGIGYACAKNLSNHIKELTVVSRNVVDFDFDNFNSRCQTCVKKLDLGDFKGVIQFAAEEENSVDVLIHNAGSMPLTLSKSVSGYEEIFSSQVIGPYILTRDLIEQKKINLGGRVIFVSSGGMYLKKLDLTDINFTKNSYNKYMAYANAKRAQVMLCDLFNDFYKNDYTFSTMHPGWVNTPGVKHSMPWFERTLRAILRTPEQGADTIIWLALTQENYPSGKFWFDRSIVRQHILHSTKSSAKEAKDLWNYLDSIYQTTKG